MVYTDSDYIREVLQLENGLTEALFDASLVQEAEELGITLSRPATPTEKEHHVAHNSVCTSADTVESHVFHARTFSSGSHGSNSTDMTSWSNGQPEIAVGPQTKIRSMAKRSLSFSEYEKYLARAEAQDNALRGFASPALLPEPAPSIFSVSTRRSIKSIKSIKNGLKSKLRLRQSFVRENEK